MKAKAKTSGKKPFSHRRQGAAPAGAQAHREGRVTAGYGPDRETVVKVLNEALATEIVCVLRYKRHYFMATGIHAKAVAAEFLQHANEEQGHADEIAHAHRAARRRAQPRPRGPR